MKWMQKYLFKIVIIITIIVVLSVIYNVKSDSSVKINIINHKINVLKSKIEVLNAKINKKPNLIKIVEIIEQYATNQNINILNTKVSETNLEFNLIGDISSLLQFINYCETKFTNINIRKINLTSTDEVNNTTLQITLFVNKNSVKTSFNTQIYNESLSLLKSLYTTRANIEIQDKETTNKKLEILYAIVGQSVLLNSKWLNINDTFQGYKLIKIHTNSIELSNGKDFKEIELHDYE